MKNPGKALQLAILATCAWSVSAGVALAAESIETLDGRIITPQEPAAEFRQQQQALLDEAVAARAAAPDDADAWVWVGRRQAYLGRYSQALATFGEGAERFPGDARFLRHRGHRLITLRRLDDAVADLSRAAKIVANQPDQTEPDGLPNALGIPTSTLQTNIWYHLGLALYLRGDFGSAAAAYQRCRDLAGNADMDVAAAYWLYLSLRRANRATEAENVLASIAPDLELMENDGYYELLRAFAAGEDGEQLLAGADDDTGAVAFPTTSYGVGVWNLLNGRPDRALGILHAILASPAVSAFGYIAAEADVARTAREPASAGS